MNSAKITLTCFFAGTVLCLGTPAGATSITPGMPVATLSPTPTAVPLSGYTEIANTGAQTYNNCAPNTYQTICGQYDEAVYKNNTNGTLDFVYQFSNDYAGDGVEAFSVSSFNSGNSSGWATNAYYTNVEPTGFLGTPTGAYKLTMANTATVNDPNGRELNFNFDSTGIGTSSILIVQTTAKNYKPGVVAIQDSLNFNSAQLGLRAYEPAVPEPGFYGILAIGLAAIVWATTRRNKQRAEESA
jgi:hypothetical protein